MKLYLSFTLLFAGMLSAATPAALLKTARSTGDPSYLAQAETEIDGILARAPLDFDAKKMRVAVHLAQHRYSEALAEATVLNKQMPDDNLLYGYIADAQIALGNYSAAEKATQWMIDQRPVNAPGLQRGARLREVFGYNEPALEWWNSSLRLTSSADREERAWIFVNISRVHLRLGKTAEAEKDARQALALVPAYPWALDALAAAKPAEASEILAGRAPDLASRYHVAKALEGAGKPAAWQSWESDAVARISAPDNVNRELIEYYATHGKLDQAITLGAEETTRREDIDTLTAYASALYAAGQLSQARRQVERALAPGIRDPRLLLLAARIAADLQDKVAASKYLKQAIEINSTSPYADQALKLLAKLS